MFLAVAFARIYFIALNVMQRVGCVLVVVAVLFLLAQVVVRRSASIPKNIDLSARARLLRIELERQRDFFSGTWLWSRLIFMLPGYTLLCVGGAVAHPATTHEQAILLALFLTLLIVAVPRSLRMAKKYACQIAELDAAHGESVEQ
jgi:hypothetical protein